VNQELPSVTVVIAARPEQAEVKAVVASRSLDYPKEKLEFVVARGRQPSAQRNAAMRAARGELLYFLDDDSVPEPGNLRRAVEHFARPYVQMVGGPNTCPGDAPLLEKIFARVLGCWLAFGPSRARYAPVGGVRTTSEKELILCNLMARRGPMLELGGFNEALYPNEENALMDELQKRGGRLVYDPGFRVERRPRSSLSAFAKMLLTYGRGRAEQFRLHPTPGSALNFVPPLFCVYLLALMATPWVGAVMFAPLALYGLVLVGQGVVMARDGRAFQSLAAMGLVVLTHVLYGAGFWRGLFTELKPPEQKGLPAPILERITPRKVPLGKTPSSIVRTGSEPAPGARR
jgi:succinoglycan biosynthesis protein ExoA